MEGGEKKWEKNQSAVAQTTPYSKPYKDVLEGGGKKGREKVTNFPTNISSLAEKKRGRGIHPRVSFRDER